MLEIVLAVQGFAPLAAHFPRAAPPLVHVAHVPSSSGLAANVARSAPHPRCFLDQADNLAGPLFGGSLLPYLTFLYFVRYEGNGLSETAKNGFTLLLTFVFATIVTSVVAVKGFGTTLANVDWLHADAEQLLTLTNVVEVVGLKLTLDSYIEGAPPKTPALPLIPSALATAAVTCALTFVASGRRLASERVDCIGCLGHSCVRDECSQVAPLPSTLLSSVAWETFLMGFGRWGSLSHQMPSRCPRGSCISLHCSSGWWLWGSSGGKWLAFEIHSPMPLLTGVVWTRTDARASGSRVRSIGIASGNPKWQGLTWAMIPSHTSGICACVYHIFYNAPSVAYIVLVRSACLLCFAWNASARAELLVLSLAAHAPRLPRGVCDG